MSVRILSKSRYSTLNFNKDGLIVNRGSVNFPGSNGNYLSVASTSALGFGTADYTVEGWIRPTESGVIVGGSNGTWALRLLGSLNGLQITRSQAADYNSCTFTFSSGTWYHIAVVRASGSVYFYVDGTQQGANTQSNAGYNWPNETSSAVGNNATNNEPYTGYVSNLRVVKGAALYSASFTAPTAQLAAISGTSLLTCQSATSVGDASSNEWAITVNGTAAASSLIPFA